MKLRKMCAAVMAALGAAQSRAGFACGVLGLEIDKEAHGKLPKEVQALYKEKDGKFRLDVEVDDAAEVKEALRKEREAKKEAEKALKALEKKFEGIDADEMRRILEKLGGDEEATLIKAGKIDEVLARRMEKAQKAHEKAIAAAAADVKTAQDRAAKFAGQVLDNHVRAAATKTGLHANAVEDALFRARTMFVLDDDGNAVQRDKDGAVVMGKDSKTAFGPGEWLEGMREAAPHWFPAGNTGGGAPGGKGGAQGKTMKRADFDAMTNPMEKAKAAREVQIVD